MVERPVLVARATNGSGFGELRAVARGGWRPCRPESDVDWRITDIIIPACIAVVGAALIGFWLRSGVPQELALREPGQDRPAGTSSDAGPARTAPVAGEPVAGPGKRSAVTASWPWFRGPQGDGISREQVKLTRDWPESGPPVLWTVTLGEGYAGAVIGRGSAYVLDYDEVARADTLRCLSLDDGREVWHNSYPVEVTRNHGMSRTVPAIVGDRIITLGPRCQVACWDIESGQCSWLIDMVLQYGTEEPRWYAGQCPLIDGDRLILAPGGKVLVTAIDIETGKPIWETPNPRGWKMTHASVVPMELDGQRCYVYCATDGVVGVSADDGRLLWESTAWTMQFATAPSPVVLPDGRLFLSSGYGNKVGSLMLQLIPGSDRWQANTLFELSPRQFNSEQQTPILYDDHLFGVRKQGGGKLVCMDLDGRQIWDSGKDRFGHGPYMIADGTVLVMSNDGLLAMVEANTTAYHLLAKFQVFEDGTDAWGPMALAGGRLIVRDMTRMSCLDLNVSGQ